MPIIFTEALGQGYQIVKRRVCYLLMGSNAAITAYKLVVGTPTPAVCREALYPLSCIYLPIVIKGAGFILRGTDVPALVVAGTALEVAGRSIFSSQFFVIDGLMGGIEKTVFGRTIPSLNLTQTNSVVNATAFRLAVLSQDWTMWNFEKNKHTLIVYGALKSARYALPKNTTYF